jgi:hypothetical protein
MTNPTPLTTTTPVARKTFLDIQKYVIFHVGLTPTDFSSAELDVVKGIINKVQHRHRATAKNVVWGERDTTLTWVADDTSQVLPADFSELIGRHIWRVDSSGDPLGRVEVVQEADYLDSYEDAESWYDGVDDEHPIARIYREEASTRKRILWIYPVPTTADKFKILYRSITEKLVNDADVLEAPLVLHDIIELEAAAEFARARGAGGKADELEALASRRLTDLRGAVDETQKPGRARNFDELGYPSFRQGQPLERRGHPERLYGES